MILSAVYSFFDSFQSFVLCNSDLYCHSDRLSFLFLLTSFSLPFHVSFFVFPLYFDALLSTSCHSFSFLFYLPFSLSSTLSFLSFHFSFFFYLFLLFFFSFLHLHNSCTSYLRILRMVSKHFCFFTKTTSPLAFVND